MNAYTLGITKEQFVAETKKHQEADAFLRGTYSDITAGEFRGCAVGCAIESINRIKKIREDNNDHSLYEKYLGIPEWIARLEDTLFENVSKERAKTWPVEFAEAINPGADLEKIKVPFIVLIMERNLKSLDECKYDEAENPDVKKAINQTRDAIHIMIKAQKGEGDLQAAWSARSAAWSAAWSAESARSAAWSAWSAAWSAESARSAAESARSAAESARSAAESAAWSAESARSAAWSARSAAESARSAARSAESARSAAFDYFADELLKLMRECN